MKGDASELRMFSWIEGVSPGRLAIMPHPSGGEGLEREVRALRGQGVEVLVSLLTDIEAARLELRQAPALCREAGIEHLSYPVVDHSVPPMDEATGALIELVRARLEARRSVVIHCYAGIGRSALIAASAMVLLGFGVTEAFDAISRARGIQVPDTLEQLEWVQRFAERKWDEDGGW